MKTGIPEYMASVFTQQGIAADGLLYAIHTDMTPDGGHADAYCAADAETLYILYGQETVVKTEDARRIVSAYEVLRLETRPLADLGELLCERLLTTGRLYSEKDGEAGLLLLFSVGYMSDAERLAKVVKNIREGRGPLEEVPPMETTFCPKCGLRYPEPERKLCPRCMDRTSIGLRLLGYFKKYWRKVLGIFICMLAGTGLTLSTPYFSSIQLFDQVLVPGGKWYGMVGGIVLLIVAVRAVTVGTNIMLQWLMARVAPWITYDIKLQIFEAMQRLSVGFYTGKRTGALMNRVTKDANNVYWFFVDGLPYIINNVLLFGGVFAVMCVLNLRLALLCAFIIPAAVFMFRMLERIFKRFHHKSWVYSSQLNSMVSDSVNGQRVIKAYAREDEEAARFAGVGRKQADIDIRSINTGFTFYPLIYLFMFLGQVVVTAVGGVMVVNGTLTLGTLLAFIAYLGMLYGPLEFMSWVSNWWARCVDSAQRMFEIIDAKPDVDEPEEPIVPDRLDGHIRVKNAWFEYEPAIPILKGLDLEVEAGKLLGIVGKTGAGKSTLANLIARLYDVKEGEVSIDGVNVKRLPLALVRKSIGIVSQDIYLFIGTIADNIRYANPGASTEDVICAAKAASAHEFIMNLPDAYETRVGSGGQDLSGGERQRLSIARTIIQNPKILILDEATAAMDTETEAAIQAALTKLQSGRTTIAIAHRLSTLRDADSLAVISEGRVVEKGTHAELLAKKGEYNKLYNIQMEGLKTINMDAV